MVETCFARTLRVHAALSATFCAFRGVLSEEVAVDATFPPVDRRSVTPDP